MQAPPLIAGAHSRGNGPELAGHALADIRARGADEASRTEGGGV